MDKQSLLPIPGFAVVAASPLIARAACLQPGFGMGQDGGGAIADAAGAVSLAAVF